MSFVRPRELVSFDPWHVTRSPPMENVFELRGITIRLVVIVIFFGGGGGGGGGGDGREVEVMYKKNTYLTIIIK